MADASFDWEKHLKQFVAAISSPSGSGAPAEVVPSPNPVGLRLLDVIERAKALVNSVRKSEIPVDSPYIVQRTTSLNETSILAIQAQTMAAYISAILPADELQEFSGILGTAVGRWITPQLGLPKSAIAHLTQNLEGARLLVIRSALAKQFPKTLEAGYKGFEKEPVFYSVTSSSAYARLFRSLNLPLTTLRTVASSVHGQLELEDLKKQVADDKAAGKQPTLVLALSYGTGLSDKLLELQKFCKEEDLWLNVEGDGLALLAGGSVPEELKGFQEVDSLIFEVGKWFGLPPTNSSHIVSTVLVKGTTAVGLVAPPPSITLPVWACLQRVGLEYLKQNVFMTTYLVKQLHDGLSSNSTIIIEGNGNGVMLLFRYLPASYETTTESVKFLNKLNKQLLLDLSESAGKLGIDLVPLPREQGVFFCLRFQPLFSCLAVDKLTKGTIDDFVSKLNHETELINSTWASQAAFQSSVQAAPSLQQVTLPADLVGLGGLRYVPSFLKGKPVSEELTKELNGLNETLAATLQKQEPLFSKAVSIDGLTCISLAVDTKPQTSDRVKELVHLAQKAGDELENQSKIIQKIDEEVEKGIKAAREQIEKDLAAKEDSLMSYIPIVGNVWSWMSPKKPTRVKGATFDLASAKLATTDFSHAQQLPVPQKPEQKVEEKVEPKPEAEATTAKKVEEAVSEKSAVENEE